MRGCKQVLPAILVSVEMGKKWSQVDITSGGNFDLGLGRNKLLCEGSFDFCLILVTAQVVACSCCFISVWF